MSGDRKEESRLSPHGQKVLHALTALGGTARIAYPSLHHLSCLTDLRRRTLQRTLMTLCRSKYIRMVARFDDAGTQLTNKFELAPESETRLVVLDVEVAHLLGSPKQSNQFAGQHRRLGNVEA